MDEANRTQQSEQNFEERKNDKEKVTPSITKSNPKVKWTKSDKKILLKALKKHGRNNIAAISKMLPHIPPQAIKSKIYRYSVISEYLYEDELVDNWLKCGLFKPGDSPLPEALLFIKLFENLPSESKEYDFGEIYDFLYHASLQESSFPHLPEKSRNMLFALLSKIDKKLWPKCQKDLWEYLGKVYNRRNIWKVYPGKKRSSS